MKIVKNVQSFGDYPVRLLIKATSYKAINSLKENHKNCKIRHSYCLSVFMYFKTIEEADEFIEQCPKNLKIKEYRKPNPKALGVLKRNIIVRETLWLKKYRYKTTMYRYALLDFEPLEDMRVSGYYFKTIYFETESSMMWFKLKFEPKRIYQIVLESEL